jgi:hypothetical protein
VASPKEIGEASEAQIIAALLRAGKVVLQPFGDSQRYDIVIDKGGTFLRVQCKTGRLRGGFIEFPTCSSQAHRGKGTQSYRGQVELFGVYCRELDKVYFVPVADAPTRQARLRLRPAKNGQQKKVRLAPHYEFPTIDPA